MLDILIANATVVTMDASRRILANASLGIADGRIERVGPAAELRGQPARVEIDGTGKIVMPGLINPHCHLSYSLARGCGDDLPFLQWLPIVYRSEDGYSDEEWYLTSTLSMIEMIKSGTTCFADTNVFEEIATVVKAVEETGIRAVLGKNIRDPVSPEQQRAGGLTQVWSRSGVRALSVQHAVDDYGKWNGSAHGRVIVRLAPAVWPVCSTASYRHVAEVRDSLGVGTLIHHTETREWQTLVQQTYGKDPTFMLADFGVLGPTTLLENAAWLTDDELALIASTDTRLNYLPTSNVKNYLGVLDIPKALHHGITLSLGTSGGLINNVNDMFREMFVLALQQRMLHQHPAAISPETVLELATVGGAKCLNLEAEIGSLEIGKRADVIVVDGNQPHMVPMLNPISTIVYCASGRDVETTVVDGRLLMRNRKLQFIDEAQVVDNARRAGLAALDRTGISREPNTKSRWPYIQ